MRLWVGLGNPEPGMAHHRHNLGFMALDRIAARHGFSPWRQRFGGLTSEGALCGTKIVALKPLTYMNASGDSVQPAAHFFKIPPDAVMVFHDELDLAFGRVRVKRGGGSAGHNGLRSIEQRLGTPDFWRVRLGIGHPGHKDLVTHYVLSNFPKADAAELDAWLDDIAAAVPLLAEDQPEMFASRLAAA